MANKVNENQEKIDQILQEASELNTQLIPLQTLINYAQQYSEGKISIDELDKFGNTFSIRGYVPIYEKAMSITSIIIDIYLKSNEPDDIGVKIVELYKKIFFKGLLECYAFVDCSNKALLTSENYDLLYPIYANFILSYCQSDYDNYINMAKDMMNMYNLQDLIDLLNNVDAKQLAYAAIENKNTLEELRNSKEIIDRISTLMLTTNPSVQGFIKDVQKDSLEKIKEDQALKDKILNKNKNKSKGKKE